MTCDKCGKKMTLLLTNYVCDCGEKMIGLNHAMLANGLIYATLAKHTHTSSSSSGVLASGSSPFDLPFIKAKYHAMTSNVGIKSEDQPHLIWRYIQGPTSWVADIEDCYGNSEYSHNDFCKRYNMRRNWMVTSS